MPGNGVGLLRHHATRGSIPRGGSSRDRRNESELVGHRSPADGNLVWSLDYWAPFRRCAVNERAASLDTILEGLATPIPRRDAIAIYRVWDRTFQIDDPHEMRDARRRCDWNRFLPGRVPALVGDAAIDAFLKRLEAPVEIAAWREGLIDPCRYRGMLAVEREGVWASNLNFFVVDVAMAWCLLTTHEQRDRDMKLGPFYSEPSFLHEPAADPWDD